MWHVNVLKSTVVHCNNSLRIQYTALNFNILMIPDMIFDLLWLQFPLTHSVLHGWEGLHLQNQIYEGAKRTACSTWTKSIPWPDTKHELERSDKRSVQMTIILAKHTMLILRSKMKHVVIINCGTWINFRSGTWN